MWLNNWKLENSNIESQSSKSELPSDLYEKDTIDWLNDEIDPYKFKKDKEFLDFIKSAGFEKIYYISVYPRNISKYENIKSVYDLLDRCQSGAWVGKIQLVIFKKSKDKYLSEEDTEDLIAECVEESRHDLVNSLEHSGFNVSELSNEEIKQKLFKLLHQEPWYWRLLSDGWKYKYLVGWEKWSFALAWKWYINVMKENWIDMITID